MFKKISFHLILIPAYFVVALFNQNLAEVYPEDIYRPLILVICFSLLLYLLVKMLTKNTQKAALITSTIIFLFFLYGLIYGALKTSSVDGITIARHRILLPVFLIVIGVIVWKLSRVKSNIDNFTLLFNLFGVALVILPSINIILFNQAQSKAKAAPNAVQEQSAVQEDNQTLPDIYYIIADAYGREDYLLEEYGFDNSEFIHWLEDSGFYVADCAFSNYAHTVLSLSSTLQMNYIPSYASEEQYYDGGLDDYIVHNTVRDTLAAKGYRLVTFENVHWGYEDADVFYDFKFDFFSPYLRPFENTLLMNSMFRALVEFNSTTQEFFSALTNTPVQEHYLRQKFILDTLENEVIALDGPKFVFTHVETPHGPYVFAEDGSFQEEDAFYRGEFYSAIDSSYGDLGYIKQTQFMNDRLKTIIEKILAESDTPPVIIIQGDHSIEEYGAEEDRMKILYAVYIPDGDYSDFYASISPVNTYRILFNQLFNSDYSLLEDKSYFSVRTDRFTWQEVQDDNPICQ
jgi:hypothetical protein